MPITYVIGSNKHYSFLPPRQLPISILAPGGFQEEWTVESNVFQFLIFPETVTALFFGCLFGVFCLFLFGFGWSLVSRGEDVRGFSLKLLSKM